MKNLFYFTDIYNNIMTEDSTVPVFDFNGNPWQVDDIAGLFTLLSSIFVYLPTR